MARCGVPHRIYLFEDLELDQFPPHRVFYFPNLFRVDEKRLELLRQKVLRDGHVVVWGPGSGISDGEQIGAEPATWLTGFEFEILPANAPRRVLISNFEHPLTCNLDAALVIGGPLPYGPVLMPADGLELGLAWAKGGNNHTGLALKEFGRGARGGKGEEPLGAGDYAALFTTAVPLPATLWRNLARFAGAHVYCESNDVLLATRAWWRCTRCREARSGSSCRAHSRCAMWLRIGNTDVKFPRLPSSWSLRRTGCSCWSSSL